MPRSKHSEKASNEEIEQSKKNGAENKNRKSRQDSKIDV